MEIDDAVNKVYFGEFWKFVESFEQCSVTS